MTYAINSNKNRARKIRTLSWSTAPRSLQVLCIGLHLIYKYRSENFNKKIVNHYRKDSDAKFIHPTRRKVIYEFEQIQKKHHRLANWPSNKILNYPESDYVKGNQHGIHTNKASIFSHIVSTANQYGFINDETLKLTPMGIKAATGKLTSDDIIAQLLKMYVKIGPQQNGVFPFKVILDLMNRFHHLTFNELSFMFGITNMQDVGNVALTIDTYRSTLKFNQKPLKPKDKKKLVKRLWSQNIMPLKDVSPSFRSLSRDYPDTLRRLLVQTGIFTSTYQNIEISPVAKEKFTELMAFHFRKPPHDLPSKKALKWYGSTDTSFLPWNDTDIHKQIVGRKLQSLWSKGLKNRSFYNMQASIRHANQNQLKQIENHINSKLEKFNMKKFLMHDGRTLKARKNVLDRFYSIKRGYIINRQAWLENNIVRALLCTSRHSTYVNVTWYGKSGYGFAPLQSAPKDGICIKARFNSQYMCIEPTLHTGKKQVKDDLMRTIMLVKMLTPAKRSSKIIYGLFIAPKIEKETWRQCFKIVQDRSHQNPRNIMPITVNDFITIMKYLYSHNLGLPRFKSFLYNLVKLGRTEKSCKAWKHDIMMKINGLKEQLKVA